MAVKFRNGEHYRNPSGFYNKVKYLLRESKRDSGKLYQIFGDISYNRNGIDRRYFWEIKRSWEAAYKAAQLMIKDNADNPRDYLNSIYIYDRENRKTWYEKLCLK
jgi:hypothetical protein